MYKNKKSGFLGVFITILILIIIVIFSNNNNGNASFFENIANKIVVPIQNGLTLIKNKVSGNNSFFADINELKKQNEKPVPKAPTKTKTKESK